MKQIKSLIVVLAFVISACLYFAGVASGLIANRLLEQRIEAKAQSDLSSIRNGTQLEIQNIQKNIDFVDEQLRNLQLQQNFIFTLNETERCIFLQIALDNNFEDLKYYWNLLPYRLEEFEKSNELTADYLFLRQQYTHLSLRTWIVAKEMYEECNRSLFQGLYFYSKDCSVCVSQGEELDELSRISGNEGRRVVILPVDINSENLMVLSLKRFYNITSAPAFVINGEVFQGRLFLSEEIFSRVNK